jgi:ribonucleoside-diphosphate reductase beta chain
MSIFDKRVAFKPFEYPEILQYKDAIRHSYWIHTEWNFISDVQDFNTKLNNKEKNAIKNTLLAIAQIEVSVKKFWSKLGDQCPKSEFDQVGMTFAESEVRHSDAYSHLLEVLSLNDDFTVLLENPVIQGRIDYLSKYLKNASSDNKQLYTLTLALFSLFTENVSLFSQFAVIKSFNKHRNMLKDIDNVVQATQKEEVVHALLGIYIINKVKEEYPEWFDDEFYRKIERASRKAYDAEIKVIDWIFEEGELDFIQKETLYEFIKYRFNESVQMIGGHKIFEVDEAKLADIEWFMEEIYAQTHTDFFYKKPTTYSKKTKSITSNDLF